ncbi:hypothetical protein [Kineococcus sp. SYSU DK006]|uniref:hypothetical protein n=1 Tax=Kineococcus sp. SYSU DK006 TaxID=3383127 RepID=UPI003D7DE6B6
MAAILTLCVLFWIACGAHALACRITYRRAHERAAVADPASYRVPVGERLQLRKRLRSSTDCGRIARLDRRLLRWRTPASLLMLNQLDDLCRRSEPGHLGALRNDDNQVLLGLEVQERGLARAHRARKRSRAGIRQSTPAPVMTVPTLGAPRGIPGLLREEAGWIERTFNELAAAWAADKIALDGRQLGELEGVHRAVDEVWTAITELPADLREQPSATGTSPMQDAVAAQNDLARKLQQIRHEAWTASGLRLDTLRRYSNALTSASELNLSEAPDARL